MQKNRWTLWDYLRVGLGPLQKGVLVGIDTTYRCNLNCRHCYFRPQGYSAELPADQWVIRLQALKDQGFPLCVCGWLGGEPLLRPEVIEAGKGFFKTNVVFTNGTRELPNWPDCRFVVSVPGDSSLYGELTGGNETLYATVKEHASRPDLNVLVAYCITRRNVASIPDFLSEWRKTSVKGVYFEFYTPSRGENGELCLDWTERDLAIDTLLCLKKSFGDFIYTPSLLLRLMKTDTVRGILSACRAKDTQLSLDPMGNPKSPCQLGPASDCSRCGCMLPIWSFLLWRKRLLLLAFAEGVWREIRGV